MNTKYSLRNFRVFGEAGADFNMTPITILTGCNGSGKSSVVKSIVLLRDFIEKLRKDLAVFSRFNPGMHFLDFSLPEVNLSNFKSVVNRASKDKEIIVSYTVCPLLYEYKVELHFVAHDEDVFNYGWLSKVYVFTSDGNVLFKAESNAKRNIIVPVSLNINNVAFFTEVVVVSYAKSLQFISHKIGETYSDYGDYVYDQEAYDLWQSKYDALLNRIKQKGELLETYVGYAQKILQNVKFDDETGDKTDGVDLSEPLKFFDNDSLVFYFPVLEHFRGRSKEECVELITKAVSPAVPDTDMHSEALCIAEAFEKSEYESFIEFYLGLENEELNDVLSSIDDLFASSLISLQTDFSEGLTTLADIRYDPNNGIHWFGKGFDDSVDFNKVYRFLSRWQMSEGMPDSIFNSNVSSDSLHNVPGDSLQSSHVMYNRVLAYLGYLVRKIFIPDTFARFKFIGNFHYNLQRLYVFDGKENEMGQLVKSYVHYRTQLKALNKSREWSRKLDKTRPYVPGDFVNKWLKKLNIGKSLNVIEDEDGLGAKVFIRKDSNKRGYPLADEGYGITQLVTILLNIEVEILQDQIKEAQIFKKEESKGDHRKVPTLALEEPEVSLHPSMQSKLADILIDAYESHGVHFIVETHSEYLIRRTQAVVANYKNKEQFNKKPFSVVYIGPKGSAYDLEYLETGRFNRSFGPGFFDEATRSCVEILKRERRDRNGKKA